MSQDARSPHCWSVTLISSLLDCLWRVRRALLHAMKERIESLLMQCEELIYIIS